MKTNLVRTALILVALATSTMNCFAQASEARQPNILVIFGDDIGQTNLSAYSFGLMGYRTPNIDRIGIWDMEFYTENPTTHYQNGILSDLEVLAIKRFKNGFGIGFIESWIQQVTDDTGATAEKLNGFLGPAFGIGPHRYVLDENR